jgi:hypothetical protein
MPVWVAQHTWQTGLAEQTFTVRLAPDFFALASICVSPGALALRSHVGVTY